MDDPDVVLSVHGHTDGHAKDPMVGKGLRPEGVHFKLRRVDACSGDGSPFLEKHGTDTEGREKREETGASINSMVHDCPPHCSATASGFTLTVYPLGPQISTVRGQRIPFGFESGVHSTPTCLSACN
jgi:hypothetical protein